MTKYKVALPLLAGAGLASLIILLLNVPLFPVTIVATFCLLPGGFLASLFAHANGLRPPLPVLAANTAFYSAIGYLVLGRWVRRTDTRRLKSLTTMVFAPVLTLVCLACLPSLNPLWPKGIDRLAEQERSLRQGLLLSTNIDGARDFLQDRGIRASEEEISVERAVLKSGSKTITAHRGERMIWARIPTMASQFPCGYDLEILLVFDSRGSLRESYVSRFPICP
jgi:hypothetical protein